MNSGSDIELRAIRDAQSRLLKVVAATLAATVLTAIVGAVAAVRDERERQQRSLRRLTRTRGSIDVFGDDTMPDWSAKGQTVVFVSNREQRSSDVWTMAADGRGQRPVARRPKSDDWNPRLSPDGRTIAFTQLPLGGGASSVWVMNRDGSRARRLTAGAEPDWRLGS